MCVHVVDRKAAGARRESHPISPRFRWFQKTITPRLAATVLGCSKNYVNFLVCSSL